MAPDDTDTTAGAADSPLAALYERRQSLYASIEPMISERRAVRQQFDTRTASEDESEHPTDEERTDYAAAEETFNEQVAVKLSDVRRLDQRIEQEEAADRSREIAERASRQSTRVEDVREPLTYRQDNQHLHSYFLDLAAMQVPEVRARASARLDGYAERLARHEKEMSVEMPKRWSASERRAQDAVDRSEFEFRRRIGRNGSFEESPFSRNAALAMESRAPSRIGGQGGYAIPPLWLIDEYIPYLRPGRVAAGLCRQLPLPEGTDSINVPRLSTSTLVQMQNADSSPVASRDIADTFQQANVKTLAGQEDVPIQLIEQSPGQILDRVIMTDLIADYNQKVDQQVIMGNGTGAPLSGGQIVGLYPSTNWGATSLSWNYTAASAPEFFQVMGAMASKVAYSRFNLSDFSYLMHPRRWFWGATGQDTTGHALVGPSSGNFPAFNIIGGSQDAIPFEGLAGQVPFGPNVYIDANVPTNDSGHSTGGTNDGDVVIGAIWDDVWLFEGDLRTRVLSEVLSGTLELRFQVYAYIAMLSRYGVSIAILNGTAMAPPYTLSGSSNGVAY